MNTLPFLHRHRRALFVLLGLAIVAGIYSATTLARSIYPQVSFPRIVIIAERGEAPVRGMLIEVTRPLEQAVLAPGLVRMRSKTVRGASEFSLDFSPSTNMLEALSYVRARAAQAGLPSDVSLVIEQQTPAVFPVLSFNVVPGKMAANDPVARARLAEWVKIELAPRLARLPDAFRVTVQSGDTREFVFETDPDVLASAGIDVLDVENAIRSVQRVEAVGRSEVEGLQYQLLVDGRFDDPEAVLDVAVPRPGKSAVPLSALGRVVETTAVQTMIVTGGRIDSVVVSVFLRDGGKVTTLSDDVSRELADLAGSIPQGGHFEPVYDQAHLVNESIAGVRDAIGIGAILAVLVMALFLGNWRMTLVAGLAIPISVILTVALFPVVGESLNLMSLGGLAVAIGLIIDDSIVVVENVARRLAAERERGAFHAIGEGTAEVVGAIVGSSLTTVVVFLPLVLLEGVVGQFFRSLALALGVSIVVSMFVSLVFAPLFLLLPALTPRRAIRPRRFVTWLQDGYERVVGAALRHAIPVGLALVALVLVGAGALRGLPSGFLPEMDEGGFVLDYAMPVGTSLQETDAMCRRVEAILLDTPEVAALSRRTGAELGFFATEQFTGDMLVGLEPRGQRDRSVFEVLDGLRERFSREVPQIEIEFVQVMQDTIADLAGNPAPIEVKALGADYKSLQQFANAVAARIESVPGVVDIKNHVSFGSPELTWRPDAGRCVRSRAVDGVHRRTGRGAAARRRRDARAAGRAVRRSACAIPGGVADRRDRRGRGPPGVRHDGERQARAAGVDRDVRAAARRERARAREPGADGARHGGRVGARPRLDEPRRRGGGGGSVASAGRELRDRRAGGEPGGGVLSAPDRVRDRHRARVPAARRAVPVVAAAGRAVPRVAVRSGRRAAGAEAVRRAAQRQLRHGADHAGGPRRQERNHPDRVRATAPGGRHGGDGGGGRGRARAVAADPDDDVRGDRGARTAGTERRCGCRAAAAAGDRGDRRVDRVDHVRVDRRADRLRLVRARTPAAGGA